MVGIEVRDEALDSLLKMLLGGRGIAVLRDQNGEPDLDLIDWEDGCRAFERHDLALPSIPSCRRFLHPQAGKVSMMIRARSASFLRRRMCPD